MNTSKVSGLKINTQSSFLHRTNQRPSLRISAFSNYLAPSPVNNDGTQMNRQSFFAKVSSMDRIPTLEKKMMKILLNVIFSLKIFSI